MLLASLLGTFAAWRMDHADATERAMSQWQREVDRTQLAIRARFEVYEDALYGTRSMFEASPAVTRSIFHDYVANLELEKRFPGIQGIGFTEYIRPAQVEAHVARVRAEGFPDYRITPEGPRDDYTAIVYLEPFDWRNRRAHGYDMFSEPVRRRAMEYARDTGGTGVSGKVTLVQETDEDVQAGFLMYLPLYRAGANVRNVAERRAALRGYIYSPFRTRDFLAEVGRDRAPLASYRIYSGNSAEPEALLFQTPELARLPADYTPAVTRDYQQQFGGTTWTLRFMTTPDFDEAVRDERSAFVLAAGMAISFLLFGLTLSLGHTERRAIRLADEMTAQLRRSEARIRAITETAIDGIVSTDDAGTITYFNPAAERIFGYRAVQMIGQPVAMLFAEDLEPGRGLRHFLPANRGDNAGTTVEITGRRADGTEFPLSASLSSWRAEGLFYTAIMRDITESRAAEAQIVELNRELTEALYRSEKLAITGRLVATIAHEINNPLEALMNLLFVLETQEVDPHSRRFVKLAQDQVALLTNISRQTLAPFREATVPVVTNIAELIDDVLALLRPKLMAGNINVVRLYPQSVLVTIYPSELRQVFTNLISNAIDAMPGGGTLTISVTPAAPRVTVTVADTGVGISADHLPRLFQPFFTTKGEKGTGVGLWVVQEIINKVGGEIHVRSRTDGPERGTTFTIVLKTKSDESSAAEESSQAVRQV